MMMQIVGSFVEFERTRSGLDAERKQGRAVVDTQLNVHQPHDVVNLVATRKKTAIYAAQNLYQRSVQQSYFYRLLPLLQPQSELLQYFNDLPQTLAFGG